MIAPAPWATSRAGTAVLVRGLAIVTAALLAIDSYVHFHDAGLYDGGGGITEGALFRAEAVVAAVVALALLVRPYRLVWLVALLVAASATGAIYLYTNVDVGALGPLPNMYEPTWALPGKRLAAVAETAATATAAFGFVVAGLAGRRSVPRGELEDFHRDEGMTNADLPCGLRRRCAGSARNLHRRRG